MVKKTTNIQLSSELEKQLKKLEKISGKSKELVLKEALLRYLENIHELQIALDVMKSKSLSKIITDEKFNQKFNF